VRFPSVIRYTNSLLARIHVTTTETSPSSTYPVHFGRRGRDIREVWSVRRNVNKNKNEKTQNIKLQNALVGNTAAAAAPIISCMHVDVINCAPCSCRCLCWRPGAVSQFSCCVCNRREWSGASCRERERDGLIAAASGIISYYNADQPFRQASTLGIQWCSSCSQGSIKI
jgi:hypothetical protein